MSRSTTGRKAKLFFCAYGQHGVHVAKRAEHNGVSVCSDCKSHWEQNEAQLDEIEADIALRVGAANDDDDEAVEEIGPGVAFEEALRDLVFESAVMGVEVPATFRTVTAAAIRVADVAPLLKQMREVFLSVHRALTGAGLHMRAGTLVGSTSAGIRALLSWSEQQTRERVEVAS